MSSSRLAWDCPVVRGVDLKIRRFAGRVGDFLSLAVIAQR
jgi:hypothetical protein